jgi:hypothetical protein
MGNAKLSVVAKYVHSTRPSSVEMFDPLAQSMTDWYIQLGDLLSCKNCEHVNLELVMQLPPQLQPL